MDRGVASGKLAPRGRCCIGQSADVGARAGPLDVAAARSRAGGACGSDVTTMAERLVCAVAVAPHRLRRAASGTTRSRAAGPTDDRSPRSSRTARATDFRRRDRRRCRIAPQALGNRPARVHTRPLSRIHGRAATRWISECANLQVRMPVGTTGGCSMVLGGGSGRVPATSRVSRKTHSVLPSDRAAEGLTSAAHPWLCSCSPTG